MKLVISILLILMMTGQHLWSKAQLSPDQDPPSPEEITTPPDVPQDIKDKDTGDAKDTTDIQTADDSTQTPAEPEDENPPETIPPQTTPPTKPTQDPTQDGVIKPKSEPKTESVQDGVTCPTAPVPATLLVNHSITQDYMGNKMTSLISGSVSIMIGSDVVKSTGTNSIKVAMTGSFPQAQCTIKGSRDLSVTVKGTCDAGTLNLTLTESYQKGSQTMTCPGTSKTYPITANTISHMIKLRVQNGSAYTAPFSGQSGSGNYSWSLKM